MGIAQCERDRVAMRAAYLSTFLLVLAYRELSPATWLAEQLGR
jgi:hypothetical protein